MDEHGDRHDEFESRADDEREKRPDSDPQGSAEVAVVVQQFADQSPEEGSQHDTEGRKKQKSGENTDRSADRTRT